MSNKSTLYLWSPHSTKSLKMWCVMELQSVGTPHSTHTAGKCSFYIKFKPLKLNWNFLSQKILSTIFDKVFLLSPPPGPWDNFAKTHPPEISRAGVFRRPQRLCQGEWRCLRSPPRRMTNIPRLLRTLLSGRTCMPLQEHGSIIRSLIYSLSNQLINRFSTERWFQSNMCFYFLLDFNGNIWLLATWT